MSITTEWKLTADVLASYTAKDGTEFTSVVSAVHWRCKATDATTGETLEIYGKRSIPRPTSEENFIDLATLQGQDTATKRATVLGWAEAIAPGFVAEKEADVAERLATKLSESEVAMAEIL